MKERPARLDLRHVLVSLVIIAVFGLSATPTRAAGWDIDLVVYLWALGMDGSMTVRGRETDVDIPFIDIFHELEVTWLPELEARQRGGNWGWFFDVNWADLGKDLDKVSSSFGDL